MSLRSSLLGAPKKPLQPVEIDGVTYHFRAATVGQVEGARKAAGLRVVNGQVSPDFNTVRFSAAMLIAVLVEENGNPVFEASDLESICEAEVGSTLAKLCTAAAKAANEDADAGKNSTGSSAIA